MSRFAGLFLCLVLLMPGCPDELPAGDAGDAAWAQRASLFLLGRRVFDLGELDVLVAAVQQIGRADVAMAMASSEEAQERWGAFLYDHLFVNRTDARSNKGCYGTPKMDRGRALAEHIAANGPLEPFGQDWSMADLRASALAADRLGPLFRANLFYALPDGIQPLNLAEGQSFRRDLGEIFTATYLGRNLVCLPCHNSEYSVTGSDDPESDRTWEIPGLVEQALFASSDGRDPEDLHTLFRRRGVVGGFFFAQETPPPSEDAVLLYTGCGPIDGVAGCADCACEERVCDEFPQCCDSEWTANCAAACAEEPDDCDRPLPDDVDGCVPLVGAEGLGCGGCACEDNVCQIDSFCCDERWDEFCAGMCRTTEGSGCDSTQEGMVQPWGPSTGCASFVDPARIEADLSNHSGYFGGGTGPEGSIWQIEALLAEGIGSLSGRVLIPEADGQVGAADAFAWLVALNLANAVWTEAFGAPLTVAHGFPRNQAQSDRLYGLGAMVTLSGFGLRDLLVAVAMDDLFNQGSPAEVEGAESYALEPVIEPFSIEAQLEEQRGNGVGDVVHRVSPRVLLRATEQALGWPAVDEFAQWPEEPRALLLERIGAFVKDTAPGFDGVGFQSLLAWEGGVGKCRVDSGEADFVDKVLREAQDRGETWRKTLATLKERLITDPTITDDEASAAEALLGVSLDDVVPDDGDAERVARDWCGALLTSPQYLLAGLPPQVPAERAETLWIEGASPSSHCAVWQGRIDGLDCPE
jgi:hypothetical protein